MVQDHSTPYAHQKHHVTNCTTALYRSNKIAVTDRHKAAFNPKLCTHVFQTWVNGVTSIKRYLFSKIILALKMVEMQFLLPQTCNKLNEGSMVVTPQEE